MCVFIYHTRLAFICMVRSMKPSVESAKDMLVRSLKFQDSFTSKALNYFNTESEQQDTMSGE